MLYMYCCLYVAGHGTRKRGCHKYSGPDRHSLDDLGRGPDQTPSVWQGGGGAPSSDGLAQVCQRQRGPHQEPQVN